MEYRRLEESKTMILKGGSPAQHKLGPIGREKDNFIVVYGETDDFYIGEFVTGYGFFDVKFRKVDCRDLTQEDIDERATIRLPKNDAQRIACLQKKLDEYRDRLECLDLDMPSEHQQYQRYKKEILEILLKTGEINTNNFKVEKSVMLGSDFSERSFWSAAKVIKTYAIANLDWVKERTGFSKSLV